MALSSIEKKHVLEAMKQWDDWGSERFFARYGYGPATKYLVVNGQREYPSKAIVGAAHAIATGAAPEKLFGGPMVTQPLKLLGFEIRDQPAGDEVDRNSAQAAKHVVETLVPESATRQAALELLVGIIEALHEVAPSKWAVRLSAGRVKLNVGQNAIVAMRPSDLWVTVNGGLPEGFPAEFVSEERFTTLPNARVVLLPWDAVFAWADKLREFAVSAAIESSKYYRKLHGLLRSSHSPGLLDYLDLATGSPVPRPTHVSPGSPVVASDGNAVVGASLEEELRAQHLGFPPELVSSYILSLKTKPFVILSGISGTGKTKLAQAVADWGGTGIEEARFADSGSGPADWRMKVFPYIFKYTRVVVPVAIAANHFGVPEHRNTPVSLSWAGTTSKGRLEYIEKRNLYYVYLNVGLVEAMQSAGVKNGDLLDVSIASAADQKVPWHVAFSPVIEASATKQVVKKRWDLISVRPDWVDGKGLMGFFNPITEKYIATPFVRRLVDAFADECDALQDDQQAMKPHFVLLDEMNLARVEYYFADLLSVMESRRQKGHQILQDSLHLHDGIRCVPLGALEEPEMPEPCRGCPATPEAQRKCRLHPDGVAMLPPRMELPRNLFITGTVNVDETTHAFSPKVLDRANVLEFHEVRLEEVASTASATSIPWEEAEGVFELVTPVSAVDFQQLDSTTRKHLLSLQSLLEAHHLHFGYRVAYEVARYINLAADIFSEDAALDLQVLQKILPKLHGTKAQLRAVLWELLCFFVAAAPQPITPAALLEFGKQLELDGDDAGSGSAPLRLPRSARKTLRMLKRLEAHGFVSFLE